MEQKTDTSMWRAAWRWHFYASFFVLPLLFILATTGLVILLKPTIERISYNDLLYVDKVASAVSFDNQRQAIQLEYPNASIDAVVPPRDSSRSSQFDITTEEGSSRSVYVNPQDGKVLGSINNDTRIDFVATRIHGTLFLGTWGDYIIEMAAGWTLVMVCTGMYLWWPRNKIPHRVRNAFSIRVREKGRKRLRDLHATPGVLFAPFLVFLALTGLPWSGFWGSQWGKFIDSMNSGYNFPEQPTSHEHATSLETPGLQISWANERLIVPRSNTAHSEIAKPLGIEEVTEVAKNIGMIPGYAIGLPADETGVYTLSNSWPSPSQNERTVYVDQYSGKVLTEAGWQASYGALAKGTALGVDTHMGRQFGLLNGLVMGGTCLAAIGSTITAPLMFLRRRQPGKSGFPRRPIDAKLSKRITYIAIALGVVFPLLGLSMVFMALLDHFFIRRVPQLKKLFGMRSNTDGNNY